MLEYVRVREGRAGSIGQGIADASAAREEDDRGGGDEKKRFHARKVLRMRKGARGF